MSPLDSQGAGRFSPEPPGAGRRERSPELSVQYSLEEPSRQSLEESTRKLPSPGPFTPLPVS